MRLPHRTRRRRRRGRQPQPRLHRHPARPPHARPARPRRLPDRRPGPARTAPHTYGTAPRRQAHPLTTAEIQQIVTSVDRTTPRGVRDAAIILLGYASAIRRAELVALTLLDVREEPAGLLLTIRHSKTDQDHHGDVVAIARGHHPDTDPVAALAAWRRLRGHTPGPLFTRIYGTRVSLEPLTGDTIARTLRTRAEQAGLDGTRITGHSLRAGHATTAALGGVPLARIAAQTRHKDIGVLVNRYIRPLEALEATSSRDLGL